MQTYFHDDVRLHHPQSYLSRGRLRQPQEIPSRCDGLLQAMDELAYPLVQPKDFGLAPILAIHDADYVEFLKTAHQEWMAVGKDWGDEVISNVYVRHPNPRKGILAKAAYYLADGSCPIGAQTWEAAYAAAQIAIAAADDVLHARTQHTYAICRPPGHHARADAAGGFCYLNYAAIAAQHLRQGFKKVLILDTDMHHGQGTQEIFYERDDVFYISIHGDPTNFYPATAGFSDEKGSGVGLGYNLNLPMPHHSDEAYFFACLDQAERAIKQYQPDALVYSLGFDIYEHDPQALVSVSTEGFKRLGQRIRALNLPTVIIQEGGYNIEDLRVNSLSFFQGFNANVK